MKDVVEEFSGYEELVKSNTELRKKLITQLTGVVDKITIDNDEKASSIEAKMAVFSTVDGILKSLEGSHSSSIKLKLQNKAIAVDENVKDKIVEVLKNIKITGGANGAPLISGMGSLEEVVKERQLEPISEGEKEHVSSPSK